MTQSGEGVYTFVAAKSSFQGTFEAGAFARGEWLLSDGSRYEGSFEAGKPSGEGAFISASSGNVTKGAYDAEGKWTTTQVL